MQLEGAAGLGRLKPVQAHNQSEHGTAMPLLLNKNQQQLRSIVSAFLQSNAAVFVFVLFCCTRGVYRTGHSCAHHASLPAAPLLIVAMSTFSFDAWETFSLELLPPFCPLLLRLRVLGFRLAWVAMGHRHSLNFRLFWLRVWGKRVVSILLPCPRRLTVSFTHFP
jgi:hypothetical protein